MSSSQQINPRYFRHKERNEGVIVFVHGLFGDGTSTWTYSEPSSATKAYWPELLTRDSTFDKQDIYVFEYSTSLSSSFSIDELAENMRLLLTADHVFKHDKVIFLTHSMGGLVTRAFLLKYRDLACKVAFIYFFATPTTGAEVARWAGLFTELFNKNPQISDLASMTSDSFLADQQRAWLAADFKIPSYVAYELMPYKRIIVVAQQSASNLGNKRLDPIQASHIDIVKPNGPRHPSYLAFKTAFESEITKTERNPVGFTILEGIRAKHWIQASNWDRNRTRKVTSLYVPVRLNNKNNEYITIYNVIITDKLTHITLKPPQQFLIKTLGEKYYYTSCDYANAKIFNAGKTIVPKASFVDTTIMIQETDIHRDEYSLEIEFKDNLDNEYKVDLSLPVKKYSDWKTLTSEWPT